MLPLGFTGIFCKNESPFIFKIQCTLKKYLLLTVVFHIIIAAYLFYGCKEDIVVNTDTGITFDSARFNWTEYELNANGFNDFYCPDSSNIFLVNKDLRIMTHLANGVRTDYSLPNRAPEIIVGKNMNDIWILGYDLQLEGYPAKLIKYNGSAYTEINFSHPENKDLWIWHGLYLNDNDIWIGTSNFVANYKDENWVYYDLPDTTNFIYSIFMVSSGKIQILNYKYITFWSTLIQLMEVNGSSLTNLYEQQIDSGTSDVRLQEFNGNLYGIGRNFDNNKLYEFSGNSFIERLNISPFYFDSGKLDGNNFNEFFSIVGGIENNTKQGICYYKDNRWSMEKTMHIVPNNNIKILKYINSDIACYLYEQYNINSTFILVGVNKHKDMRF